MDGSEKAPIAIGWGWGYQRLILARVGFHRGWLIGM